jgi:hypothetical protein
MAARVLEYPLVAVLLFLFGQLRRSVKRLMGGLERLNERIESREARLHLRKCWAELGTRDDDICIAAFMKSGTTWVQMIMYQLLTNGNMNFKHIYDVSYWPENAYILPRVTSPTSPRLFKTHLPYDAVPRSYKGRFIYVMRDGRDVAASLYHHFKSYYSPDCTFDDIFKWNFIMEGERNWFAFTREWLSNRYRRKILYVRYEDMKADLERVLRRIITFCGLKVDENEFPRVLKRSNFAFMKQHQQKFGEQPGYEMATHPAKIYDNFIRKGEVGEGKQYMSAEHEEYFEAQLQKINWDKLS